jgi:hypothetical protein
MPPVRGTHVVSSFLGAGAPVGKAGNSSFFNSAFFGGGGAAAGASRLPWSRPYSPSRSSNSALPPPRPPRPLPPRPR